MKLIIKVLFLSCALLMPHDVLCCSIIAVNQEEDTPRTGPVVIYDDIKDLSPDSMIHPITVNGRVWNLQWHSSDICPIKEFYCPEEHTFHVVLHSDHGLKNSEIKDFQFASYKVIVEKRETKEIIDPLLYVFYLRIPQ